LGTFTFRGIGAFEPAGLATVWSRRQQKSRKKWRRRPPPSKLRSIRANGNGRSMNQNQRRAVRTPAPSDFCKVV
jgi:hypothetical protein